MSALYETDEFKQAVAQFKPVMEQIWADVQTRHGKLSKRRQAAHFARAAMVGMDRLMEGLWKSDNPVKPACQAGCSHCCHLVVEGTPAEGSLVADFVRNHYSPEQIERIVKKLRRSVVIRKEVEKTDTPLEAYASKRIPCAFLEEGSGTCMVYPVRPLACRGFHSADAKACEAALDNPGVKVPQHHGAVLMSLAYTVAFQATYMAAIWGLKRPPNRLSPTQAYFPASALFALRGTSSPSHAKRSVKQ